MLGNHSKAALGFGLDHSSNQSTTMLLNISTNNTFNSSFFNESQFCQQERSGLFIGDKALHIFIALYGFVGCFGLPANAFVIFIIKTTRQSQNQSMKLLMYLSCVDLYSSVIALIRIPLFIHAEQLSCTGLRWSYFFTLISFYATNYLFALTGLDRFLRLKYLDEYDAKFTPLRFRITLYWYFALIIILPTVTTYLNTQYYIGYASRYVLPFNIILVITTVIFYALSIFLLRRLRKFDNEVISDATQNILNVTKIYFYLFIGFTGGTVCYLIILSRLSWIRLRPGIMVNIMRLLPTILGSINAIAFVVIHPLARRYVAAQTSHWLFLIFRRNTVDSDE